MSTTKQTKSRQAHKPMGGAVNHAVEAKGRSDRHGNPLDATHQLAWLSHPQEMSEAWPKFRPRCGSCRHIPGTAQWACQARMSCRRNPGDTRFADPIWSGVGDVDIVKEWYLR